MSHRRHFSTNRSTKARNYNQDNRQTTRAHRWHNGDQHSDRYYGRDYDPSYSRRSHGYSGGRQRSRFHGRDGFHVNKGDFFKFATSTPVSNKTGSNKYKSKRSKWKKVEKIERMNKTLSEKVIYRSNYLETIFKFLNFFDLISIGSILSKYHYNVISFNQENSLPLQKSQAKNSTSTTQSECKDGRSRRNHNNNDNTRDRYPNKIFEFCFKNTFKNLIQLVIEPSKNESLPNLTIGKNKSGGKKDDIYTTDDVTLVQIADTNTTNMKFEYNKKEIYLLFNDWFYLIKKIVESNVMFVKYGHNSIIGTIRQEDEYRDIHQQWAFQVNMDESAHNLCLLLAIDDALFVQYWLKKVKINNNKTKNCQFITMLCFVE